MTGAERTYRIARAVLVGFALFGLGTSAQLLATGRFHAWLLPVGLAGGALCSWRLGHVHADATVPAPRWVRPVALVILVAVVAAIAYGSVATPARHWDGTVAWEPKAFFLTREPSIDQTYFARPEVFCHSRNYPLLQPLSIASGNRLLGDGIGRSLFPLLLAGLAALVGSTIALRTRSAWWAWSAAVAVTVTPALVNPAMGAADSGFGELFLLTAVAGIAASLALEDRLLLPVAIVVAILVKPEGAVYAALAIGVLWARGRRTPMRFALAGWALGAAAWLPLQQHLQYFGHPPFGPIAIWAGILAFAAAALVLDMLLDRLSIRSRTALLLIGLPLCVLAIPALSIAFRSGAGAFGGYLGDPIRPFERLARLPEMAWYCLEESFQRFRFGTTFVLLALAVFAQRRARRPLDATTWWTVVGVVSLFAPFLLSPEPDLEHHVKSSMTRFLLHWLGAAWIVAGIGLAPELPARLERARTD